MKTTAFKNTDIGPIPEDWEVKRIEDFYEVGSSKRVFQSQWRTSGIPFYRARDIVGFRNGEKAVGGIFIDASLYEHYKRSFGIPAPGDLLVTAVGTLGKVFRVVDEAPFYFKDGNIIWLRANGQYDSCLLEQLFESGWLDSQINDTAGGSTVGTYTITNAKKTLLPLPPLPEQRRIAAALSDADELVASLDKLIEKKKRVKEGAMQRLLSGETRLPGFTGKWVEKPVSDSLQSVGALNAPVKWRELQTPEEGSFPAFSASGQDVWTRNPIFHEDGIVVSAIGSRCGKAFLARGDWGVVANTHVILARNGACIPFWFYILNNEEWWIKAGTGQPYVMIRASLDRTTPTPDPSEQRAIAAMLSDMDEEIAALARERTEAERIKQGMMQELLTGKTRLGNNSEGEYR